MALKCCPLNCITGLEIENNLFTFTNFPKMQSFFRNGFLEYPEKTALEQNNAFICFLHAHYGSESHFRKNGFL